MLKYIWVFSLTFLFSQTYDYSLEDVNSSSDSFGQNIGPSFFDGQVTLHYFGHFNWGLCSTRFGQLDDLVNDLNSDGYSSVQLIGIGKSTHSSSLNNWTGSNNESVCIDPSPFSTWSDWGASQRDLIVLDTNGNVIFDQSVSGGIPSTLAQLVIDAADCDPNLMCAEVISCIDGLLYPTACGPDNCDAPIGDCDSSECVDGEFDNTNPCQPSECIDGQWYDIVIDCAEQMGVPCEGGVYIDPVEGECCSTCVPYEYGDINQDGVLNVIDVVQIVNLILSAEYNELADLNDDGLLNVIDVVALVNQIIN